MDLPLDRLRTEVALVTQEHHVFVGIRDNVGIGSLPFQGVPMAMEILEERRTSIKEKGNKGGSCCSGDGLRCDTASVAGSVSQRPACTAVRAWC